MYIKYIYIHLRIWDIHAYVRDLQVLQIWDHQALQVRDLQGIQARDHQEGRGQQLLGQVGGWGLATVVDVSSRPHEDFKKLSMSIPFNRYMATTTTMRMQGGVNTGVLGIRGLVGTLGDTRALQPYFRVDCLSRPHPGYQNNIQGALTHCGPSWGVTLIH